MGTEWQDAGWGQRTVFVIAATYWMAMLALAVASLPAARAQASARGGSWWSGRCSGSS